MNLRDQVLIDVATLNTKDWAQEVKLVAPDGVLYVIQAIQVLYDHKEISPSTGEPVIVKQPVVVLTISSLTRIPQNGEVWAIEIPSYPGGPLKWFTFSPTRAKSSGSSLGFIKIYPQEADQSEAPQ